MTKLILGAVVGAALVLGGYAFVISSTSHVKQTNLTDSVDYVCKLKVQHDVSSADVDAIYYVCGNSFILIDMNGYKFTQ